MSDGTQRDGGPAFPNITPDMAIQGGPGMSLRDWFAGQIAAVITVKTLEAQAELGGADAALKAIAITAYQMADAMLKARRASDA